MADEWHSKTIKESVDALQVTIHGLTSGEAQKRLGQYGTNEIKKEKGKSPLRILAEQFTDILIIILLIATALSIAVGEATDAVIIIAIIVASATIGFTQEYRSEKAVEALKKMTAPTANVLRDGKETKIPASQLVPGDIILLNTGDKVPADSRLLEAYMLKMDEASLTGESTSVNKDVSVLPKELPLNDRKNIVFTGTVAVYGRGKALVTSTGMNTEFGKIAQMVQAAPQEKTPLEKRMGSVGKWIGILAVVVAISVGVVGIVVEQRPILDMVLWAVSLAVAAVPEALPAIITGALAIGMYRMAKVHTIVKRLPAVETLGSTSVICSDKTGTMTKGEMTVQRLHVNNETIKVTGIGYQPIGEFKIEDTRVTPDYTLKALLKIAALCNDSDVQNDIQTGKWSVKGDPTEGALVVAAQKAGIIKSEVEKQEPRVAEIPFSSERKRMTTIHASEGKKFAYLKGAPEVILTRCNQILLDGKVQPLTTEIIEKQRNIADTFAGQALRNLSFAYKELPVDQEKIDENIEQDLIFVGTMGMIDPPRPEVRDAIEVCRNAGIRVVMITGDHKLTATAVAKDLNLVDENNQCCQVLTGQELEKMTDAELEAVVEKVAIYARVSPEHKTRIVKAWKKKDEVVAMTGDGVNDAPALKMSDIGIAMGISGTEVTKEAADMVLADDNFASIVKAVREGREIFENIKKYLTYLLQCNIMEILVMFIAVVSVPYLAQIWSPGTDIEYVHSAAIALTAVQILWVNLVTDGLPAIALGVDPADPDLMNRKPRKLNESIFTKDVKVYLTVTPIIMTVLLLLAFISHLPWQGEFQLLEARTQIFTAMIAMELAIALSCRSLKYPLLKVGPFKNKFLWYAIFSSFGLQLLILYAPGLQALFDVHQPGIVDWAVAGIYAVVVLAVLEVGKYVTSRRRP